MFKQILFLITLTLGFCSCKQTSKTEVKPPVVQRNQVKENIRFDFTAERIYSYQDRIEIKGTLYNDSNEDVYFLSTSGDGEQYSLRFDKAKFLLEPLAIGNACYTIILKIAPKGRYDFQAHFSGSSKEEKIKLGFDFYSVDKYFDLKDKNQEMLNIFNRPEDKQTIIWAGEKTIKSNK